MLDQAREFDKVSFELKKFMPAFAWVDPFFVNHVLIKEMPNDLCESRRDFVRSRVASGGWDRLGVIDIAEHPKYRSCHEHVNKKIPMVKTSECNYILEMINKLGIFDGCKTLEDACRRLERIEAAATSLRSNGFFFASGVGLVKNYFCPGPQGRWAHKQYKGRIILLSRDNKMIFCGSGMHRISFAKLYNAPIPCRAGCIHEDNSALQGGWRSAWESHPGFIGWA